MTYRHLSAESDGTRIRAQAYMLCVDDTNHLKAAVIVGPEQTCVGIFANLFNEKAIISIDDKYVGKCEYNYRRMATSLPCKWCAMLILSKDPRLVWNDDDLGLIAGIKRTTETDPIALGVTSG